MTTTKNPMLRTDFYKTGQAPHYHKEAKRRSST